MRCGSRRQRVVGWEAKLDDYLPHPLFQAVWPALGRLKASRWISPLYQGEHVGLSGLYALINAFRLALADSRPLTHEDTRQLVAAGIRFIALRGLLQYVLTGGIRLELWRRMAEALREYLAIHMNAHVHIEQPFRFGPTLTTAQLLAALETFVVRQRPVVILRRGAHYTIVAGFTPASLILFDSAGTRWVRRSSCGAAHSGPVRHRFCPGSIIAFSA